MYWPQWLHIMLVEDFVHLKQLRRCISRPIELICGPMHELAVHSPGFGQTDPAILVGKAQGENHPAHKWRVFQDIDIVIKFERRQHAETLNPKRGASKPQSQSGLRYLRSTPCQALLPTALRMTFLVLG